MKKKPWFQLIFPKNDPLRWVLPITLMFLAILLQWQLPGWADRIEAWTVDMRFRIRGVEQPDHPIVIVALDDASYQMMSDFEGQNIGFWPRARWADLVSKISAGNPKIIALDIVFAEPGWDPGGDMALAQAIEEAGNVVLAARLEEYTITEQNKAVSYSPPIAPLPQSALVIGMANVVSDIDGVIRRTHVLWPWGGDTYPSLSLVTATLYNGAPIDISRDDFGDDLSLPINYRGPEGTFETISMHEIWSGEVSAEKLQGAIVMVGYTTKLKQDRHLAPFTGSAKMPGVEIQANIVDTLLTGNWLQRPPTWLPLVLVTAAGLVGFILARSRSPMMGVIAFSGSVMIYLGVGLWLFARKDFILPLAAPIIIATLMGGAVATGRMIFAERDKRLLRQRFAGVMSPERLQAVLDNWEELLNTDRPEKEAAVLFCDIRGFTHTTETLMRQNRSPEMVKFLNAYLDILAKAVFLEGGVIYRTFGDGLLILFGLPEPLPDHALKAVRAAMRMAVATAELQPLWPLADQGRFKMGIGINAGPMVDAIMGRGRRFDYTVLGDAVNAAARIESHCKVAMEIPRPAGGQVPETVTILLGDDLYHKVKEHVIVDENIPPFEARGKSDPLKVVRLLGLKESEVL